MEKKHIQFPLFFVIAFLFTAYLIIISGILGITSYGTSKDSVSKISQKYIDTSISKINVKIETFLAQPHNINTLNSSFVTENKDDFKNPDILAQHFLSEINVFDSVSSIYLGNNEGGLVLAGHEGEDDYLYTITTDNFEAGTFNKFRVNSNNIREELLLSLPDFDARTRSWYQTAREKMTKTWSDVYILFTGQDMAIAAAEPVFGSDGNLIGVLSIDLFLSKIYNFLKQNKISENGEVYIIEKSGLLIASSADESPIVRNSDGSGYHRISASESQSPFVQAVAEKIVFHLGNTEEINEAIHLSFNLNKENIYSHLYPIKDQYGIDWILVAAIPEGDFMQDIWQNNRRLVFIIIIASIISAVFSFFASKLVVSPVKTLNFFAKKLADGQWEFENRSYFIGEIDSLNSSFNKMAVRLTDTLKNLNIEVKERKLAESAIEESIKEVLNINKKLEDYSYTISHDLKEPIRSIRTFSQFIKEDYEDKLDEEGIDYLQRIIKASSRMALMIDDLLLLSQIGKSDVSYEEVSLPPLIEEIQGDLLQNNLGKRIEITAKDLPVLVCQPTLIKILLQNLIGNSIKYSDEEKILIVIRHTELGDKHEFSIEDNGHGIAEDQHEKIFGLFRKAHQNKNMEGSGAGLAIASSVVDQHGGKIWVDWSIPGRGTKIKFTISKELHIKS